MIHYRNQGMRVIKLGETFVCHGCARPFDRDPNVQRREEKLAKLKAIPDDDEAARKFYYFTQAEQEYCCLEQRWTAHHGLHSPQWGCISDHGMEMLVRPDANTEEVMKDIDNVFLPGLRESILYQLDGTAARREARWREELKAMPFESETPARIDRTPISSLYPFGYMRLEDGTVLALQG